MADPLLVVQNISKRYGSLKALDRVDASFYPGEVHCVLGENGAGKSTLMSILAGFTVPDGGQVTLAGSPIPLGSPQAIRSLGLAMVHQHFMLVPAFSVAENLELSNLTSMTGLANPQSAFESAAKNSPELAGSVPANQIVETLPVGQRQRVELLKALARDAKILILDEPTAVLSPAEVESLFALIRDLRDQGRIVILIAHKLSEVMAVADRVTILRRGKLVATAVREGLTPEQLTEWMVGEVPERTASAPETFGDVVLAVDQLQVKGDAGQLAVRGVSLEVRSGEILGIGGVDGNGQIELAEALAGVRAVLSGNIRAKGTGGYIPQDRQSSGLALEMSIQDNLFVGALDDPKFHWGPFLRTGRVREWAQGLVQKFEIKVENLTDEVGSLSGGNQQKVVVSRVMSQNPAILIVMSPTRGLDVRATEFVRSQIIKAAGAGMAVVLFSTDADELAETAHRTLYMSRGELGDALLGATA